MGVKTTRIVKFIRKGDKGDKGDTGRLPVPYGIYSDTGVYTCTDVIAPYVLYSGQYYVMNKNTTWIGASFGHKTPAQDYADYGANATWILMEKYKAAFIEMLIADFGKIADAIFYGHLMFSQQGKIDGVASSNYTTIQTLSNGDVDESAGKFVPNFWVNFLNGKMHAVNGIFDGDLQTKLLNIEGHSTYTGSTYGYRITDYCRLLLWNNANYVSGRVMKVQLPTDKTYIGKRVVLVDNMFPPYTKTPAGMADVWTVKAASGYINAAKQGTKYQEDIVAASEILFYGGYVEFLGLPNRDASACIWMLVGYRATYFSAE